MSLASSTKEKKYDKRILDWNLRNGVITQAEYEQHLQSLADETDKTLEIKVFSEADSSGAIQ